MNKKILTALLLILMVAICTTFACRNVNREEQTSPSLRKITLLLDWKSEPTYAGFYIARENGFYRKRGLDVTIVEGNGATVSAQVIGSNQQYFIGSCSGEATAIARSKGIPVKSVAVFYHNVPTVIYSRADTPIRKPSDLIGKRIGLIDGSVSVDEYRGLVAANNIDRKRIKEVSVGWDAAPLLSRKVDGLMNYEELTPVELRLHGNDIVVMRFSDFGLKAYSLNLIANDSAFVKDSKAIKDLVDGTVEGYIFLREKPDQSAAIFSRLFPERDQKYVHESTLVVAQLLGSGVVGDQTRLGWTDTLGTLSRLGLLARKLSVDEVAASAYLSK
jgi:ABC-type nitrate/sulfonate/bicarbonate transport system substrate-binding protein